MPVTDYYNFENVNLNDNITVVNIATGVYDLSRNGQSNLSIVDTYTKFGKPSLYRSTPDTTVGTNYYYTTATMSTSFTFAFWIRTIGGSSSECAVRIIGDNFYILFYLENGDTQNNIIQFSCPGDSNPFYGYKAYLKTTNLTAGKTWNANDWNHVAFIASYNEPTTSINIYYNGSIVNYEFVSQDSGYNTSTSKITAPKNATDPIIVSGPMFTNNSVTMYIGGSPNNYGLVCYLSNIYLFNSALSSTELKMLINNNSFNTSQYGFNSNIEGDAYINGTTTCNLLVYELNNGSVFPVAPCAYLISGNNINPLNGMMFPIFGNITDYSSVGISNMDYAYYVMPGYTLIVYNEKLYQDSTPVIIDNSTGVYPLFNNTLQTREGAGKSCKVSYLSNRLPYYQTFTTPPIEVSALNGTKLTFTSGSNTYIHYVFTSNTGKLTLNNIYTKYLASQIKALVVGGGGSGGGGSGGAYTCGGGGGGDVYFNTVSLTAQSVYETLDMVIGNGGAGATATVGNNGGESKIAFTNNPSLNITCKGGGGGGSQKDTSAGNSGGSGGGGAGTSVGSAGTNSYNAYSGGAGVSYAGGGGGGAAASGSNGVSSSSNIGGKGGNGYQVPLDSYGSPISLYFGAGGGGNGVGDSSKIYKGGNGGIGGGGGGIALANGSGGTATQGTGGGNGFSLVAGAYSSASGGTFSDNSSGNGLANSGSGGGGGSVNPNSSGSGGSGIVIIIFTVATENMSDFIFN